MFYTTKSEDDLFSDIERFSGLFITIQATLETLAKMRRELIDLKEESTKDLGELCKEFEVFVRNLRNICEQITTCEPDHFPLLALLELSQAMHYVLKRIRVSFPPFGFDDPILGVSEQIEAVIDLSRPEKRLKELTLEEFREEVAHAFEVLIWHVCKIAHGIKSYALECGISRPPTQTDAALTRLEITTLDTNETVHRYDSRDRRHRAETGVGGQLSSSAKKRVSELWNECQGHPEWFGDKSKGRRVTKRTAYDYLDRKRMLPPLVDCFKTFLLALDSARKRM